MVLADLAKLQFHRDSKLVTANPSRFARMGGGAVGLAIKGLALKSGATMRPQDFHIRDKANQGVRVGLEGGGWLQIRSVWSDAYTAAMADMNSRVGKELLLLTSSRSAEAAKKMSKCQARIRKARLVASLISGWSVTEHCTESERIFHLVRSPRLRRQVELIAENMFSGGLND